MRAAFIIVILTITSLITSGQKKLEYYAEKYLRKISRHELKLKRQPVKKGFITKTITSIYDGRIDSIKTALLFFEKTNIVKQASALRELYINYGNAQTKFDKVNYIKRKIENKVLKAINKSPEFSQFFNKYSQLAGLFKLPGNNDVSNYGADGLQTQAMVREELQQRTGSNTHDMLKQHVASTSSYLDKAKDKLNRLENVDDNLPDFQNASQQTKQFFKRLEYGVNIQSSPGSFLLPVSTDINFNIGYKITSGSVLGIASCYRMGWGKDISHLNITHEGIGFKTFCELKLKGSFWIRGGGEMNYRSSFKDIDELKFHNLWQKSAVAGISKKYALGNKVNGTIQLLYDFLHSQQTPAATPFVFRTGYTF